MILKSMSRKTVSFGQLLEYVNAPEHAGPAILQNFRTATDEANAIHGEFLENSRFLPPRKNGNMLYHEVLSFSDLDAPHVTPGVIEDLARKYLELRAPYALAYGKAHFDTDCPHVHLIISANNYRSSRRLRLSRQQFSEIKKTLEIYQRERYPVLSHSLVIERNPKEVAGTAAPRKSRSEEERSRRLSKTGQEREHPSRKERVRETVLRELAAAYSGEALFRRLMGLGLRLYRRGRTVGVEDVAAGRRYRLTTLGLAEIFRSALRRFKSLPERIRALRDRDAERQRERDTHDHEL